MMPLSTPRAPRRSADPTQIHLLQTHAPTRPFLKWAGGKSQLLPEILKRIPVTFRRYFEPFLGSGAVFFALAPESAVLSDANDELVSTFTAVRDDVDAVIASLRTHVNTEAHFLRTREVVPAQLPICERAARLIYLNRTCYNGLYRVNRRGQFNTPFGRYENPTICNEEQLRSASAALKRSRLISDDYRRATRLAREGDFVYFDPPYFPVSKYSDFRRYHSQPFAEAEHRELFAEMVRLAERGCHVMASNSDCDFTRALYSAPWKVHEVDARRLINSKSGGRGKIGELLITNY